MSNLPPEAAPPNPYAGFESPTALVAHVIGEDPQSVDWRSVAERSVDFAGQEGAANLSVLALDQHLRSQAPTPEESLRSDDVEVFGQIAADLRSILSGNLEVAQELRLVATHLSNSGDEIGHIGRGVVSRLEEAMTPSAVRQLHEAAETLAQILGPYNIGRIEDAAMRLSEATARLDQGRGW